MKKVAVIMGSDSDLPVVESAISTLNEFSVPFEVHVWSAHRTPEVVHDFTKNAIDNDFGVVIAAAGKAAHLAGAIAANTTLPVIGIPVKSGTLDGIDALFSTVQMPSGIPVATETLIRNGRHSQTMLGREDRLRSMVGAFSLSRDVPAEGSRLLLVDDVLTTGATLVAAADTLALTAPDSLTALVLAVDE